MAFHLPARPVLNDFRLAFRRAWSGDRLRIFRAQLRAHNGSHRARVPIRELTEGKLTFFCGLGCSMLANRFRLETRIAWSLVTFEIPHLERD